VQAATQTQDTGELAGDGCLAGLGTTGQRVPSQAPGLLHCGDDDAVEPNMVRIPADGEADARAILERAGGRVTAKLVESLDGRDFLALGRYGARQPTVALRAGSAAQLRDALLATALCQLGRASDPRDLMAGLAVHHFVARQLCLVPSEVFGDIAARLPGGPLPDLLRDFGGRHDITLSAFGWQLVQTAQGPDFMPAPR
jgi:hypothetical protein